MNHVLAALITGSAFTFAGGTAAVAADNHHIYSPGHSSIGGYNYGFTDGYGVRGNHGRLHDDLEHRQFHRELDHRDAHRRPMSWGEHERLHDHLDHDAYHDRLHHRSYHRHVPRYGRFGVGYGHHRPGSSSFWFGW